MPRLIDIQDVTAAASPLTLRTGDILALRAPGAQVRAGADCIECLGFFQSAVVGDNGKVLSPMGLPDTVLLRASGPGRASISVVRGDSLQVSDKQLLQVAIEA